MHKLFLCWRYLQKRRIAFFGIAAVSLCVSLLIVITSLFRGFIDAYLFHMQQQQGDVILQAYTEPIDYQALTAHLEKLNGVQRADAVLAAGALLYMGRGDVRGVELVGVDLEKLTQGDLFRRSLLVQGERSGPPDFSLSPRARQVARDYLEGKYERQIQTADMPVGAIISIGVLAEPDELTDDYDREAITARLEEQDEPFVITTIGKISGPSGTGAQTEIKSCWPVDVVQTGSHMSDSTSVFLPFDFLAQIIGKDNVVVQIVAAAGVDRRNLVQQVKGGWQTFVKQNPRLQDEDLWRVNVEATLDNPEVQLITGEIRKQLAMFHLMLGLIGLVASLLIFVILYMVVLNKRHDIGIVRSLGASRSAVAAIFLGYGLGIGLAGSGVGLLLGAWVTQHINDIEGILTNILGFKIWKSSVYMFQHIPNQVAWGAVGWIVLSGVAIAALGALAPAFRAARLQPVETLRFE